MYWPGTIKSGQNVSSITHALDLLPTLCNIAEVELKKGRKIDGVDRSNILLHGNDNSGPNEFYFYSGKCLNVVQIGDWKLHVYQGPHVDPEEDNRISELYNLKEDIGETINRAETHPEIIAEFLKKLTVMRTELEDRVTYTSRSSKRSIGRVENPKTLTDYREERSVDQSWSIGHVSRRNQMVSLIRRHRDDTETNEQLIQIAENSATAPSS